MEEEKEKNDECKNGRKRSRERVLLRKGREGNGARLTAQLIEEEVRATEFLSLHQTLKDSI